MQPYFYPPEIAMYDEQFPDDYSTKIFPYDKNVEPRFVELLNMAMTRDEPLTKEELISEYGEEIYDRRMHPEKYGMASLREGRLINFFHVIKKRELGRKEDLFKEYTHIILDVLEGKRQTVDHGLYFNSYLKRFMKISQYFEWNDEAKVIFSYIYPKALTAKLHKRYTEVTIRQVLLIIPAKKLLAYIEYGKKVLHDTKD